MRSLALSKIALLLAVLGVVVWLPLNSIYCITNPTITVTNTPETEAISKLCDEVDTKLEEKSLKRDMGASVDNFDFLGWRITTDNAGKKSINIEVNISLYSDLSQESKQEVMQIALSTIYESNVSRSNRNKIYNELCKLDETTSSLVRQLSDDVRADFAGAYSSFKPFSGYIGWLFGILALGMFITLGLSCVVDISYINLPFIQVFLTRDNNEKPKLVSLEAWSAVQEADSKSGVDYVSPNGIYIKHKGKQYIMVAICLLYLTSGKIFELIALAMDYFRGLVG